MINTQTHILTLTHMHARTHAHTHTRSCCACQGYPESLQLPLGIWPLTTFSKSNFITAQHSKEKITHGVKHGLTKTAGLQSREKWHQNKGP